MNIKDAFDWIAAGGTKPELEKLAAAAPKWVPPGRPVIGVSRRFTRDISSDAWRALIAANEPPQVFERGRLVVDIVTDAKGNPTIRTLDKPMVRGILDRDADFMSTGRDGDLVPSGPPSRVVDDVMASKELPLPPLNGIIDAPIFSAEGRLCTDTGYQPATGYYLNPGKRLSIAPIQERPDKRSVDAARSLLLDDLLADFPFASDADRAHAVAALILPFVRPLIDGPTPLHLIEAPTPGSGKGLLAEVLSIPATGQTLPVMTVGGDDEETRKRITATLMPGPRFVLIDNVRNRLDSAALSAALTSTVWKDRVLGHSRMVMLHVDCVWVATANNPQLSLEVARRTPCIRLDPSVERPWLRTGFKHSNLRRWALRKRRGLIWAALTLIQKYIAEGKPAGEYTLGSYEAWAEVMGGILDCAGIPGFLGNMDRSYSEADQEVNGLSEFCAAWWEEFRDIQIGADLLFGLCTRRKLLLTMWGGRTDHSGITRFGIALSKMRDRIIGHFRICQLGPDSNSGAQQYRLQLLESAEAAEPCGGFSGISTEKADADLEKGADHSCKEPETPVEGTATSAGAIKALQPSAPYATANAEGGSLWEGEI